MSPSLMEIKTLADSAPPVMSSRTVKGAAKEVAKSKTQLATISALNSVTPGLGTAAAAVLRSRRIRRVIIGAISCFLIFIFLMVMLIITTISAAIQDMPRQVVSSVVGWVPGVSEGDGSLEAIPETLCQPQPEVIVPGYLAVPPEGSDNGEPDTAPPSRPSTAGWEVLADNGRITDHAMSLARLIPDGTSAPMAMAWLVFSMSHPEDTRGQTWEGFQVAYDQSMKFLPDSSTGVDIARTIDKSTDYRPYILPASALVYAGILDDRFPKGSDSFFNDLTNQLMGSCLNRVDPSLNVKTPDPSNPILPATSPGWEYSSGTQIPAPEEVVDPTTPPDSFLPPN